ncbi:hypothetical protein C5E06_09570 [Pseudoclavibacter sp. RFBI5]|uniref:hypothetical protein n=1 Tax=Pseudoclavibacter sp. RFBI5 TaxID=2080578 RepID=UPI000CE7DD2B|nr:hypothetical protein [Pseudoclavibacter sp. RFBI5]PPG02692.1 hypothetical protein C5E06_09570 [Pseudoclavibacter sp. RFBI5]
MTNISQAAQAQRDAARGNGVAHAGQFGHQAHSAPGTFEAEPAHAIPVPVMAELIDPADVEAGDQLDMFRLAAAYLERNPEDDDLVEDFERNFQRGPRTVSAVTHNDGEVYVMFADTDESKSARWDFHPGHASTDRDRAPARVLDRSDEKAIENRRQQLYNRSQGFWRRRQELEREAAVTAASLVRMSVPDAKAVHVRLGEDDGELRFGMLELRDGTFLEFDDLQDRPDLEEMSSGVNAILGEMDRGDPDWLWRNVTDEDKPGYIDFASRGADEHPYQLDIALTLDTGTDDDA